MNNKKFFRIAIGILIMVGGFVVAPAQAADTYPTGSLVNDGGTIYFINERTKIPFTNWQAFVGLGYSANNVVSGDLSGYTPAQTYKITSATAAHPWGSWLLNGGTVYYTHESGLIPVPSWDVFVANGGLAKQIVKANAADLGVLNNNRNLALLQTGDGRLYGSFTVLQNNQDLANNGQQTDSQSQPVACTMDVKLCPDGKTYVSRQGPACEFAACPAAAGSNSYKQLDPGVMIYTVEDDGIMSQPLVGNQSLNPPLIAQNLAKSINFAADILMVVPAYAINDPNQGYGSPLGSIDLGNGSSLLSYQRLANINDLDFSDSSKVDNFRYIIMHELGHMFGIGLDNSLAFNGLSVTDGGGHWARNVLLPSTLMSGNCISNIKDNGNMTISMADHPDNCTVNQNKFDPFLMYLAGFYSASELANQQYIVTEPKDNPIYDGAKIIKYLTINDIVAGYQKVSNQPINQKKNFKLALVLFLQKGQTSTADQISKIKHLGSLIPTWWNEGTFGRSTISLSVE